MQTIANEKRVGITIPAKSEFVGLARLAVAGMARDSEIDEQIIDDMKIAVSEVGNNIVNNAAGNSEASLSMELIIDDQALVVEITCSSRDLEAAALAPILWPDEPGQPMGLAIISALSDKVELDTTSPEHTILRLIKYLWV